jgi:hypothetical protein
VLRVAGFIVLGTVLARPLLARAGRGKGGPFPVARWVSAAAALLLLDLVLKALLAPRWAILLRPCLATVSP